MASGAWEVFTLFLIPIGGGIPAGVLLGQSKGIGWQNLLLLYFLSDLVLALIFEPVMLLVIAGAKRSAFLSRVSFAAKKYVQMASSQYGTKLGPMALILVAFGVDPMTGRAVAVAAGHGFILGWTFAIIGDLFYFLLILACTLWLRDLLGDGTAATFAVLLLMILVPIVFRKIKVYFLKSRS